MTDTALTSPSETLCANLCADGTGIALDGDQVAAADPPAHSHESPALTAASASTASPSPGAPRGNRNAAKHGHRGSKMHPTCKAEENHVNARVRRVIQELIAKHGDGPLTSAQENLVSQIRRALERDRVAAKLLRQLKDLKGGELNHDQLIAQREMQAASLRLVESCLNKLGLGIDTMPDDPWSAVDREFEAQRQAAIRAQTPQSPAVASGESQTAERSSAAVPTPQ